MEVTHEHGLYEFILILFVESLSNTKVIFNKSKSHCFLHSPKEQKKTI